MMKIIKILNEEQLQHVRSLTEKIDFQSGDKVAHGLAKEAKKNNHAIPERRELQRIIALY